MAVKDYNTDPDLNTSISGINIAEGCPPSGINDAIRQLMADVKEEKDAGDDALEVVNDRVDTTNSNLAALDAAVVHKTGDETIAGAKTFTGDVTISGKSKMELSLLQTEVPADVAPSGNKYTIVRFKDAGENSLGALANTVYPTNGVKTYLVAASRVGGENAEIEAVAPADGIPYATAPTTPAGSTGKQIVTADYAKDTYLAKSGGKMTGDLLGSHGNNIKDFQSIELSPPSGAGFGGFIDFHYGGSSGDYTSRVVEYEKGVLEVVSTTGKPMKVNGYPILTSAGGTMTGILRSSLENCALASDADNKDIVIFGGSAYRKGAYLKLVGKDKTQNPGCAEIVADNGTTETVLRVYPNGTADITGKPILALVASWSDGPSWYRRYNDGWIEQGGTASVSAWSGWVTFHSPFTQTPTVTFTARYESFSKNDDGGTHLDGLPTTTGFTHHSNGDARACDICWRACGY